MCFNSNIILLQWQEEFCLILQKLLTWTHNDPLMTLVHFWIVISVPENTLGRSRAVHSFASSMQWTKLSWKDFQSTVLSYLCVENSY